MYLLQRLLDRCEGYCGGRTGDREVGVATTTKALPELSCCRTIQGGTRSTKIRQVKDQSIVLFNDLPAQKVSNAVMLAWVQDIRLLHRS